MQYYLETNALYNILKIERSIIKESFTSAFAILELVAGINEEDYHRRRTIAVKIDKLKIPIEWAFPQQIIIDSFDFFDEYELVDKRPDALFNLFNEMLKCESVDLFKTTVSYNHEELGWDFFLNLDMTLNQDFIDATILGNKLFRETIVEKNEIEFEGQKHTIQNGKDMESFFQKYPIANQSFTIQSLANAMKKAISNATEEEVYNSYNNLIPIFVDCFSRYCSDKACNLNSASKNDFQDLTHLLYLRDHHSWKIISNDNIYKKYVPDIVLGC